MNRRAVNLAENQSLYYEAEYLRTSTSAPSIRSRLSKTTRDGACQHASSNQSFILPLRTGNRSSESFEQSMNMVSAGSARE